MTSKSELSARAPAAALILAASTSLTGCEAIAGIFKAGVGVGVVGILLVVGLVGAVIALVGRH